MSEGWTKVPATEVVVGDRARLPDGSEMVVSRVHPDHMGIEAYLKLVEDTDERWYAYVMPKDHEVEVRRAGG